MSKPILISIRRNGISAFNLNDLLPLTLPIIRSESNDEKIHNLMCNKKELILR